MLVGDRIADGEDSSWLAVGEIVVARRVEVQLPSALNDQAGRGRAGVVELR